MIMTIIRKHSGICAALILFIFMFAAPYLVPLTPDSAVFRSGTLGLLLISMCIFPVKNALDKHNFRIFSFSSILAFIFSVCLGLGSELRMYNQLLPGLGSLIRRLAVPCMAFPLFACLFSYLFVFEQKENVSKKKPIPYIAFFLLFSSPSA